MHRSISVCLRRRMHGQLRPSLAIDPLIEEPFERAACMFFQHGAKVFGRHVSVSMSRKVITQPCKEDRVAKLVAKHPDDDGSFIVDRHRIIRRRRRPWKIVEWEYSFGR